MKTLKTLNWGAPAGSHRRAPAPADAIGRLAGTSFRTPDLISPETGDFFGVVG